MEALLTNSRTRVSTEGLAPVETLEYYITNLVHYLYRKRSLEPMVDPPALHTIVVVEEAQTLVERHPFAVIPFYNEMLLRCRSLGIAFIFVVQDINRVDPTIQAACSNVVLFTQSTGFNKRAAHHIADLSSRETSMLGELQTGECFIRFAGHPTWPYPFLARIPSD
jgi:DNA helicase HerA-like ATPase